MNKWSDFEAKEGMLILHVIISKVWLEKLLIAITYTIFSLDIYIFYLFIYYYIFFKQALDLILMFLILTRKWRLMI